MSSSFFHAHVHSEFSILDAISSVDSLVEKAYRMGQPAMALTDHGNGAGWVQLYNAGNRHNMPVFPGVEGYLTTEPIEDKRGNGKIDRFHIGMLALNFEGYQHLSNFMSMTHSRPRFNRFPRFDLNDFAEFNSEDIAVLTGCYFGLVQQTLVNSGYEQAKRIVEMYARLYPNTFVEIQNHNIDHEESEWDDDSLCEALVDIAQEVGLPVMATQDSHYCDSKEKLAHELMKRMVYRGGDGVNEFPGDSFHLASTEWVQERHDPDHWKLSEEGAQQLLDLHDLQIPALDNYKPQIPTVRKNPQRWMEKKVWKALDRFESEGLLAKKRAAYEKRIKHESDIIEYLGQAGYFTLVHLVTEFCNDNGIYVEARGSANGSLICYLLGITSIDPIRYDLLFERFLSRDRKKPPDIDLDIEDVRRSEVLEFLDSRFGAQQIGTFQQLGARDNDDKGSLLVSYNSYLRAKLGNDKFIPKYGKGLDRIADVKRVSSADYKGLRSMSKLKVKRSYGVHPAGMLLSGDNMKVDEYVPTMLVASSNTNVTQMDGDDVEEFGFTKMDILGQRTLTTMRRCQELIGVDDPLDFKWIPDNDKPTVRYLSKGRKDNGVFQFEGYAMAQGARSLKIRSTNDCILAGALFRPACIDSGVTQTYIDRRFDPSQRVGIEYPHPAFEEVLKKTNGVVLFQEQVLEIMRRLGLDYAGINTFFKIVKDSGKGATERNLERIKDVEKQWEDICARNNIDDPDWAWEYIEGYTKYGFNKSHSAGYGVRSYRVAYLKVHYPLEFMAALLESWAGKPKEPIYIREARNMDIRLLAADVNVSGANWTLDPKKGAIRRGLASIKGIGRAAAEEIASNAPYEDIDELIEKNSGRSVSGAPKLKKEGIWSGNLGVLKAAGAFASLGYARGYDE